MYMIIKDCEVYRDGNAGLHIDIFDKAIELSEEEFKEIVKLMNVDTSISFDTKVVLAIHNKLKELL